MNSLKHKHSKPTQKPKKIGGVDTELGYTTIENLIATTKNTNAKTALTKIQTAYQALQKEIAESTEMDTIKLVDMAAQSAQQQLFIIQNQADISDETKNTVITQAKQTLINSILQAENQRENLKLTQAQIQKIANDITVSNKQVTIGETANKIRLQLGNAGISTARMAILAGAIETGLKILTTVK